MLSLGVTVFKRLATESTKAELLGELKSLAAALSNPLIFG
jgi:hypothetical protein